MHDFKKQRYLAFYLFAAGTIIAVIGTCIVIIWLVDDAAARNWSYRFVGAFMMLSLGGILYPLWFTKWFMGLDKRKIDILLLRSFDAQLDRIIYASVAPLTVYGRAEGLRCPKTLNPGPLYDPSDIGSIKCSGDEWQQHVRRLMEQANVIVLFLSENTPGVDWELQQLSAPELARKTVLVTNRRDEWNDLSFEHHILVNESWSDAPPKLDEYIRARWFLVQPSGTYTGAREFSQFLRSNRLSCPWPTDMASHTASVPSHLYNMFALGATYAGFVVAVVAVAIIAFLFSAAGMKPDSSGSHHNANLFVGLLPAVAWTVLWLSLWGAFAPRAFLARSDVWSLYASLGLKSVWNTKGCSILSLAVLIGIVSLRIFGS